MAFIGDYMRGVSGDTGMPSITGLQQYIQQGFDAGRAQGQNQQLSQLSQAAFNDTGDQQQQDVSRAIGIDPKFGYSLAGQVGAQSAAERQTATLQKLGKVASAIVSAKQRGDETTAEGLYQAALPDLRLFASQRGAPPPPTSVDGSDMGAMYKLAVMYGNGMPAQEKPISVSPDTTLIDPNTHKVIYQGQGDAGSAVTGMTYNGMPVFRDKMGNLKDVRGNPIPQGAQGAPAAAGAAPAGLPAETQAYVPKVTAALGGAQPFDQFGQPTAQLLDAVQQVESGGNPNAVSPAGAQGAYQFMPATAASVGVNNPFDPQQARQGASKYLAQLYQQFGGDANKAIAAYNAGPGRVAQATAQPQQPGTPDTQAQAQPPGLQYNPGGSSALEQKITIARRMGATDAQIRAMVIGTAGADAGAIPGDPSLSGPDYFASIQSPGLRNMLIGISEGKQGIPRMYRNTDGQSYTTTQIQQMVSQGDPTFSMANLPTRIAARKDFTSGQDAKTLTNLAQASAHIQQLIPLIPKVAGHSLLPNTPINAVEDRFTGDVSSWKTKADAVAHEARAVFAGTGGGTLEELNKYLENLSPNASVAQKQAAIQSLSELLASRLAIMKAKYVQAMGRDDMGFDVNYGAPTLQAVAEMKPSDIGYAPIQTTAAQARSTMVSPSELGSGQQAPQAAAQPSESDKTYLMSHPEAAHMYDAHFGAGASAQVLGH